MASAASDTIDSVAVSPVATGRSLQFHHSVEPPKTPQPLPPMKGVPSLWNLECHPVPNSGRSVERAVASSSSSSSAAGDEVGPDSGSGHTGGTGKRLPWNRASNDITPGPETAAPIIEADSWPALSAFSKSSSQKSLSEPVKTSSDVSSSVSGPQGTGSASTSASSNNQMNFHEKAPSTVSNQAPKHQRSMKRDNGSSSSNGNAPQSPGPRNPPVGSQSGDSSPSDDSQRSGSLPLVHGGNEHRQPQRNSTRYRSTGTYQRTDGSQSQSYGNRRGGFYNNREARIHQPRGYPRGPHTVAPVGPPAPVPFVAPLQPRHFRPPMGYSGTPSGYHPRVQYPVNFLSPMQSPLLYIRPPDPNPNLCSSIVMQISYYFSNDNLVKDTYLRQNMDDQGWVPVALIAGFRKISQMTDNVPLILDVMRNSPVVEVQGDKLRRRNDWSNWIMSPSVQFPHASGTRPTGDSMAASVQTISLNETAQ